MQTGRPGEGRPGALRRVARQSDHLGGQPGHQVSRQKQQTDQGQPQIITLPPQTGNRLQAGVHLCQREVGWPWGSGGTEDGEEWRESRTGGEQSPCEDYCACSGRGVGGYVLGGRTSILKSHLGRHSRSRQEVWSRGCTGISPGS